MKGITRQTTITFEGDKLPTVIRVQVQRVLGSNIMHEIVLLQNRPGSAFGGRIAIPLGSVDDVCRHLKDQRDYYLSEALMDADQRLAEMERELAQCRS